jgi:hypothetical protein
VPLIRGVVAGEIDAGLAFVTEDRNQLGLILASDVRKNITLASLDRVSRWRLIDDMRELRVASDTADPVVHGVRRDFLSEPSEIGEQRSIMGVLTRPIRSADIARLPWRSLHCCSCR